MENRSLQLHLITFYIVILLFVLSSLEARSKGRGDY